MIGEDEISLLSMFSLIMSDGIVFVKHVNKTID